MQNRIRFEILKYVILPSMTVEYELYGGTNNVGNLVFYTRDDLPVSLEVATKAGNTFYGWYTDPAFENQITDITVVGDLTLHALLSDKLWKVTVDGNGGLIDEAATYELEGFFPTSIPGICEGLEDDLIRSGYTFDSWTYDADGLIPVETEDITEAELPTKEYTVFAQWSTI